MEADIDTLLADLSEPQREAVTHQDGPILILAGPGSGKTRVVTRRAAYLAATVTRPGNILAVTFTNKAAREMRERIEALGVGSGMTVATFHAFGAKLLRIHHDRAGVSPRFTIYDTDDRRKLIKKAVEECDLSTSNWPAAMIEREISLAKAGMQGPAEYAAVEQDWRRQTIARIYAAYQLLLGEMDGLDFDDLLMRVARLLDTDDTLRAELEDRYKYVLVDEYQDTNAAQYRIAHLLTRDRRNLCATGDPDQSIYGWRGADIENILRFEEDHPNAKVVRLEQNYRSTKRILAAADALITGNVNRKAKKLWTQNEEGPAVRVLEVESGDDEAATIAAEVSSYAKSGGHLSDIAVFYRVNSLSRILEESLIRAGIAYQIARGVEFYNRKEIRDVLAYLRVLINPSDEIALLRIINSPARGIGATTVQRLVDLARRTQRRIRDVLDQPDELAELGRSAGKVAQFAQLLTDLEPVVDWPAHQAVEHVASHSGLRAMYAAVSDADGGPVGNIDELISAASDFQDEHEDATLPDWLEHAALVSDVDAVDEERGAITLMTLHAAKGLEFPTVYIIGLEEGLLPMRRHGDDDGDDEEERRLCFVGMTRARKRLTLLRARYRMLRGVTERTVRSPFLDELPQDQVEYTTTQAPRRRSSSPAAIPRGRGLPADIAKWEIGTLVRHPAHGLGRVLSMVRGARRTHVDVEFEDGLTSSWVLEFAPLERVDFSEVD